jgi:hypothetical protein
LLGRRLLIDSPLGYNLLRSLLKCGFVELQFALVLQKPEKIEAAPEAKEVEGVPEAKEVKIVPIAKGVEFDVARPALSEVEIELSAESSPMSLIPIGAGAPCVGIAPVGFGLA